MTIAFFDLDKTLLAMNSGQLWLRRELELGHITRLQAARAALWIARYHLGFSRLDEAVTRAIATLEGTSAAPLRARTEQFFEREVRGQYRPGALEALARHRSEGHALVLLTSSSNYLSERVADELGLDGILCNTLEVDGGGNHTGRSVGALCFGEGKLVHALEYSRKAGVGLERCFFYTDSYSDLPVLERVGQPVAVNPDVRLRRLASLRGWRIVDWGRPSLPTRG